jgi:hypothetical protein
VRARQNRACPRAPAVFFAVFQPIFYFSVGIFIFSGIIEAETKIQ